MAEKNISKIKISNNDEDIFVLKSKDFEKVNELYTEVFDTVGLKNQIKALEQEVEILKQKVDSLYNGNNDNYDSNSSDSFESNNGQ